MDYLAALYIDPGTGGMLFTILFGLFGVVVFSMRALMMRLKFMSGSDRNAKANAKKIPIVVHNENKRYWNIFEPILDEFEKKDMVFAVGPAGTGKTYLSIALAVKALKDKQVKRIILSRPAVEAGEKLGFLPGDMKDKIDPYLQPLYDALEDMIPATKLQDIGSTLGHELEIQGSWTFLKDVTLSMGMSYMVGTKNMQLLKRASEDGRLFWAWISLQAAPRLLNYKW